MFRTARNILVINWDICDNVLFKEYGRDEVKCLDKTDLFWLYVAIAQGSYIYLLIIIYKLK